MLFVLTPGVDWAYAIAAGLRYRSVLPAVAGMLAGHALATVVVAAGVGALVTGVPLALTALTVVGAAYLIWLGVTTLTHPPEVHAANESAGTTPLRQAGKGFGVSGLNPKVFLLFLALLPQFVRPASAWPVPVQMLALGGIHVANCAVVYIVVAATARRLLRARPSAARIVSRASGVIMMLLGVWLLVEQFLR
jgi:threonine/homoserine/homoserine lactone efflux protein